jgi:hypothetical protein
VRTRKDGRMKRSGLGMLTAVLTATAAFLAGGGAGGAGEVAPRPLAAAQPSGADVPAGAVDILNLDCNWR